MPNQLEDEIVNTLELMESVMGKFGFKKFEINLSTRYNFKREKGREREKGSYLIE